MTGDRPASPGGDRTGHGDGALSVEPARFKAELVGCAPRLRAFARSLTGNLDRADDLVQETIARAIVNREKFAAGTNMDAWLITILRNQFFTDIRKRKREVEDVDGFHAAHVATVGGQIAHVEMQDVMRALQGVPAEQREALLLISSADFSYEEAAEIAGVAVGTIKSRVNRARTRLNAILNGEETMPDKAASEQSVEEIDNALAMTPPE